MVIEPRFAMAEPFAGRPIAPVADDQGWAWINVRGAVVARALNFDNGADPYNTLESEDQEESDLDSLKRGLAKLDNRGRGSLVVGDPSKQENQPCGRKDGRSLPPLPSRQRHQCVVRHARGKLQRAVLVREQLDVRDSENAGHVDKGSCDIAVGGNGAERPAWATTSAGGSASIFRARCCRCWLTGCCRIFFPLRF